MSAQAEQDAEMAAMMATLTPEEIAAINDEDAIEQEAVAKLAAQAAQDDDDDEDGGEDDDADANDASVTDQPAAKEKPADSGDAAKPPAEAPAPAPAPVPAPERKPAYRAELPEDFEQQQASIKTRTDELRAKFKAGEIDLDDFEAQRETLDEERRKLDRLAVKADIAKEMQTQTAEELWNAAINRQFDAAAKPEGGGIDYKADKDKLNDLDGFVKMLAANPANADKDHDWFMQNAHKRVLALHDIKPVAPAAKAPAAAPASRKAPTASIPASLANVPGSDAPGDLAGEFDHLDALEGIELEAAISRMSPAQREKYARGG